MGRNGLTYLCLTDCTVHRGAASSPLKQTKLVRLLALLIYSWDTGELPIASDDIPGMLGIQTESVGQYRAHLRRVNDEAFAPLLLEEGPGGRTVDLASASLGLHSQIPSDLATLLSAEQSGDVATLRALVQDGARWDGLARRILPRKVRKPSAEAAWRTQLVARIEHARQLATERPSGLPPRADPFVGREDEIATAERALEAGTIATLHGTPGMGRTAIAIEIAHRRPPADVLWVSMEDEPPTADPADAFATALGIAQVPQLHEAIAAGVQQRAQESNTPLLLIIDDCSAKARELLKLLRERCGPRLQILTTSPTELHMAGVPERGIPVHGLPTAPDPGGESQATRLFIETVARQGHVEFDERDRARIVGLCSKLQGQPFHITMAAKRHVLGQSLIDIVRYTSFDGVAETVSRSLDSLDTIQHDLLVQLSVFAGAFDHDTAAKVLAQDPMQLGGALQPLQTTFLLRVHRGDGLVHYRIETTVREEAAHRLARVDPEHRCRSRWRRILLKRVHYDPGQGRAAWLNRVEREIRNAAGVIEASLVEEEPIPRDAMALAAELILFWQLRSRFADGRRLLSRVLEAPGAKDHPDLFADLQRGRAVLGFYLDDDGAADEMRSARALAEQCGAKRVAASVDFGLGVLLREKGRHEQVVARARKHVPLRVLADANRELGWWAYRRGNYPEAEQYFKRSEEIAGDAGEERSQAEAVIGLGWLERRRSRYADAEANFEEARLFSKQLQDRSLQAEALNALGELARAQGHHDEAATFLEEGQRVAERAGVRWIRSRLLGSQGELQRATARTRADLRRASKTLRDSLKLSDTNERAWRHFGLGVVEFLLNDFETATNRFRDSLNLAKASSDGWQIARAEHRLARITLLQDGDEAACAECALPEMMRAAVLQEERQLLGDLGWTLQDIGVAVHRLGLSELTATTLGARRELERQLGIESPGQVLRSSPNDWYADVVEETVAAARAAAGQARFAAAEKQGAQALTVERGRPRLQGLLLQVAHYLELDEPGL